MALTEAALVGALTDGARGAGRGAHAGAMTEASGGALVLEEQAVREGAAATETLERLGRSLSEAQNAANQIQQQRLAVQAEHELLADQEAIALRRQLELDQELTQRVDSARKREQEARHRASQLRSELQDMAHSAVEPKLDMA